MDNATTPGEPQPIPPTPSTPPVLPATPPPLNALPKTPRRWHWIWIFAAAAVGLMLFLGLATTFLQQFARGLTFGSPPTRASADWLEEVVLENHNARDKIALVEIGGIIMSDGLGSRLNLVKLIQDQLEKAGEDDRVRAVILRIDSPGGEVLASDDLARAIRDFQEESEKPVIASMAGVAASGGYYTAVPSQWIVAHELTMTGSIGVIMHSYNYRGLLNKVGVRPEIYKSGKFKDMLSGEKLEEEILPEEKRMVQDMIDEVYTRFKTVIREGRAAAHRKNGDAGRPLVDDWEQYADGRILSGKQAYNHGFVDELGDFDTAFDRARKLAKVSRANLIRYQRPLDLSNLFRLFGQSEARTLKLDLGVDLPQLPVGRLYFLAPMAAP